MASIMQINQVTSAISQRFSASNCLDIWVARDTDLARYWFDLNSIQYWS